MIDLSGPRPRRACIGNNDDDRLADNGWCGRDATHVVTGWSGQYWACDEHALAAQSRGLTIEPAGSWWDRFEEQMLADDAACMLTPAPVRKP